MKKILLSFAILIILFLPSQGWTVNYSVVGSEPFVGYQGAAVHLAGFEGSWSSFRDAYCCGGMWQTGSFYVVADDGSFGTEVYLDVSIGGGMEWWGSAYNMADVSGGIDWIMSAYIDGESYYLPLNQQSFSFPDNQSGSSGASLQVSIPVVTTTEERIIAGLDSPHSAFVDLNIYQNFNLAGTAINPYEPAYYSLYSNAGASIGYGNTPRPVPEPSTLLLLGSGLAGLVGFRRKFKG